MGHQQMFTIPDRDYNINELNLTTIALHVGHNRDTSPPDPAVPDEAVSPLAAGESQSFERNKNSRYARIIKLRDRSRHKPFFPRAASPVRAIPGIRCRHLRLSRLNSR